MILAAGSGSRFGQDKTLLRLRGKSLIRYSLEAFLSHPEVSCVGILASESNIEAIRGEAGDASFVELGGETRSRSSQRAAGLSTTEITLIHDAARPMISHEAVSRVIQGIRRTGAAAPGIPVTDTIKIRGEAGYENLPRERLVAMQTPQGARTELLRAAYEAHNGEFTDEMALLQAAGVPFEVVEGDEHAHKLTKPGDLARLAAWFGPPETRSGLGYDIHAFSKDPKRPLMLGGIQFPGPGLEGHSDADVLLHAVCDALLGAVGMGDIGQHFPNNDPEWKNRPSLDFVTRIQDMLFRAGWRIVNIDVSVIAEMPKIMPRAHEMRTVIAQALAIEPERVSLKATTNERLGSLGRAEGIAAFAVAQVIRSL